MARFPKPPEGSWTQHYPELGTEPVSYEDSISPEIYELEREAIFKRAWRLFLQRGLREIDGESKDNQLRNKSLRFNPRCRIM